MTEGESNDQFARRMRARRNGISYAEQKQRDFHDFGWPEGCEPTLRDAEKLISKIYDKRSFGQAQLATAGSLVALGCTPWSGTESFAHARIRLVDALVDRLGRLLIGRVVAGTWPLTKAEIRNDIVAAMEKHRRFDSSSFVPKGIPAAVAENMYAEEAVEFVAMELPEHVVEHELIEVQAAEDTRAQGHQGDRLQRVPSRAKAEMTTHHQRILLFLDGNAPTSARVILASTGLMNGRALTQLVEEGLVDCDGHSYGLTPDGRGVVAELRAVQAPDDLSSVT